MMTNGRTRRLLCAAALLGTMLATPVIGNDEGQKGGTGGTPGFSGTWTLDPLKSDQAGGRRGGGGGRRGRNFHLGAERR